MIGHDSRLRLLVLSNIGSWTILALLVLSAFQGRGHGQFTVIDANRLNIVAEDGQPVLVLANRQRMPGPRINGTEYPPELAEPRGLVSGMIFYNDAGDEVGGLIYNGLERDSGHSAVGHLSFDQWKQNQVVALQYLDNGRTLRSGLRVWDRPTDVSIEEEFQLALAYRDASEAERDSLRRVSAAARARGDRGVERVFVGSQDRVSKIELRDTEGHVRVRLLVDDRDSARLEFLDATGNVIETYPSERE